MSRVRKSPLRYHITGGGSEGGVQAGDLVTVTTTGTTYRVQGAVEREPVVGCPIHGGYCEPWTLHVERLDEHEVPGALAAARGRVHLMTWDRPSRR